MRALITAGLWGNPEISESVARVCLIQGAVQRIKRTQPAIYLQKIDL